MTASFDSNETILIANKVTKKFQLPAGELLLFHDINLTVKAGDSLAIVGPSGAGKSTLLSLLAGLDSASSGEVIIAGNNLAQMDDSARAKMRASYISFVFQSFHLIPELTALENVSLPLEIRGQADATEQAAKWLANVGLGERLDHRPTTLSGGEQQRTAIARAFATQPRILFADEPTGNLDEETGNEIISQLFALNKQQQTTLILITHDMRLAKRCNTVLTLQKGQLIAA